MPREMLYLHAFFHVVEAETYHKSVVMNDAEPYPEEMVDGLFWSIKLNPSKCVPLLLCL